MDWGFLTALDRFEQIPWAGLVALFLFMFATGKIVFSRDRDDRLAQMREAHAEETRRTREDRDARLQAKDDEIARMSTAHTAEVERAREAEQQWREAWREAQDIAAEVRSQNRDLVDSLYFVRKVVGSLPQSGGGDST